MGQGDRRVLVGVWLGTLGLRAAVRSGRLGFSGAPALTRRMPKVLQLSPVAEIVRSAGQVQPARSPSSQNPGAGAGAGTPA